jgi:hypothetical protein
MQLLDRDHVFAALEAVNEVLRQKYQKETVMITGGAALMFLFDDFYRPIKDIDACGMSPNLTKAVEEVTWEKELPGNWFNDDASEYYYPKETVQGPQFSNLSVQCPSKMYLLCLKIHSKRSAEQSHDPQDVEFMIERMPEVQTDKDWQFFYKKWFGKTDWNSFCAESAHQTLLKRSPKTAHEAPHTDKPPEPLMIALINQSEWRKNPSGDGRVHIFTDEPEEQIESKSPFRHKAAQEDLIEKAIQFAKEKHKDQRRKWTGEDYIVHPEAVANTIKAIGGTTDMICAAYLHDVIEDQGVAPQELTELFGPQVSNLVVELSEISKLEDGNRRIRKEIDRKHYSNASPEGQTIKLADMLNNGYDIVESNPGFARTYIPELEALFNVLTKGDATLRDRVAKMLAYAKQKLSQNSK